ncbi:hypothetical protein BD414DRAFT_580478 [Trametes punicea]|nr:hypothetical protein BD414DRAFT_580478 [Trametes punicea]
MLPLVACSLDTQYHYGASYLDQITRLLIRPSRSLYGVTLSQVALFLHRHRDGSRHLRALVWALFVLENAQTIFITEAIWLYTVSYHQRPLALGRPARSIGVVVYITCVNNLLVRCVYAYRVYKLGCRHVLLPLIVVFLSVAVAALAIVYGTEGVKMTPWNEGREFAPVFYAGYSCELAADLIITVSIVSFFSQRSVRSDGVAQKFLAYSLNSGLLVMICVICSIIAVGISRSVPSALSDASVVRCSTFFFCIPRILSRPRKTVCQLTPWGAECSRRDVPPRTARNRTTLRTTTHFCCYRGLRRRVRYCDTRGGREGEWLAQVWFGDACSPSGDLTRAKPQVCSTSRDRRLRRPADLVVQTGVF